MYLKILLIIIVVFSSSSAYAASGSDFSLNPDVVWGNIKGYAISVWQKALDVWGSKLKPWVLKMWTQFKSFFDKERVEDEFKKELSEAREGIKNIFKKR